MSLYTVSIIKHEIFLTLYWPLHLCCTFYKNRFRKSISRPRQKEETRWLSN